jgi:protein TonB
MQIALGVSIAVHAVLLTVRFVDPEAFNRVFEDTPLEVVLVNARADERPTKAQAIAQANMAGGGDAERGRATSPLPPALLSNAGEDTEQDQQRQLRDMQEQQNLILSQVKHTLAAMPPTDPQQAQLSPDQVQREEKRRQLIKLLAEIERRINAKTPAPRSVTSARPPARRCTRCITIACAAVLKTRAPKIFHNSTVRSFMVNSP